MKKMYDTGAACKIFYLNDLKVRKFHVRSCIKPLFLLFWPYDLLPIFLVQKLRLEVAHLLACRLWSSEVDLGSYGPNTAEPPPISR